MVCATKSAKKRGASFGISRSRVPIPGSKVYSIELKILRGLRRNQRSCLIAIGLRMRKPGTESSSLFAELAGVNRKAMTGDYLH
jgi:hypothetical protein